MGDADNDAPASGGLVFEPVVEILPQTERTKAMLARKREMELRRKEEEAARIKEQQQKEAERRLKEQEEKRRQQERRKRMEEEERKRREEEEQRSRLEGGLEKLIHQLKSNTSDRDVALSGLDLNPVRLRLLMQDGLANNKSLFSLDLSRRGLTDQDGEVVAQMLRQNKYLGALDLEGNYLGVESAKAFAVALKENTSLKYLNLSNNLLTANGNDESGLTLFFTRLEHNRGIRVLNLFKNHILPASGEALLKSLERNEYITQIDMGNNELEVAQHRRLQALLARNSERQSELRRREKMERHTMYAEDLRRKHYDMALEAMRLEIEAVEERRLHRMKDRLADWQRAAEDDAQKEKDLMDQLMQEADDRKEERAKKGKKKGKKKK
ncbi:unnamed protein product [Vitrella brassicaformis CCMP3155]|uniref:Uncharacterized protein n=1 Tax=Vitrella brassicaformis (strain CCMP3155) TaxID=1169540 RepID=A0A0G4FFC3_VITBC|nr:unnamed protein product [Vitrella brassicaformis CCMP3155]|eukprot:CEM11884.1 unnamed protein product [Vitrella brassicaformis CCMP3155]